MFYFFVCWFFFFHHPEEREINVAHERLTITNENINELPSWAADQIEQINALDIITPNYTRYAQPGE